MRRTVAPRLTTAGPRASLPDEGGCCTIIGVRELADGVWVGTGPVRILGMPLTSTMTVLRLADGSLVVHSPVALDAETRGEVEALGRVAHLYAPNLYHHLHLPDWADAFPEALVHAPAGLEKKQPRLRIARTHDQPHPAWGDQLIEICVEGFRLAETAVFHASSATLIVADLVHNIGRPSNAWTRIYAGTMGFYDRIALSRAIRWAGFSDRAAARRSVDAIVALPFQRVVVGHGEPITRRPREALASALEWLPSAP